MKPMKTMKTKTMMRACLFLLIGLAGAAQADPAADLKKFVDGVTTLTAEFKQVQSDEKGKVLTTSTGRMWLSRPGRFRWAYETPYKQLMVCDGKKLWMYDPDLSQVTVRAAGEALLGTPAALLSQRSTLSDQFTLEDGGSQGTIRVVRLKPKSGDSDFKAIELSLKDGIPQRMKFLDQLGGTSTISFSNVDTDSHPEESLFHFTAPKGTEVIEAGSQK
jgi:outer membrane lipoprotein carrier protein